ncbi:MAG: glycosyltransferase family 39 protein [Pseudomonadota bacterium]
MSTILARLDAWLSHLTERRVAAGVAVAVFAIVLFLPAFVSLPLTDRDEARYAQASRQMAETGDLIDIRLGAGPRYNKPVGIYWLQSAAVWITGESREMWVYRLPSLISAVAASVLTYLIALSLMGGRVALLAGLLMASTLTLGAEARIAKTDATLLATILLAMWPLGKLYMTGTLARPGLFWVALGVSMLIKGPIGVMVAGSALGVLSILRRDIGWIAPLGPKSGAAIFVAIVLPWYLAITFVSGWAFWEAALIDDFLSKIGEGQESHGAPPGSYLLGVWFTFWPAAILLPLGLRYGWHYRKEPAVIFCLAWVVPSWIVFELTATKLLHYVLPLYPALAILTAAGWLQLSQAPGRALRIGAALVLAIAIVFVAAPLVFTLRFGGWPGLYWILGTLILVGGALVFWSAFRAGLKYATACAGGLLSIGAMTAVLSSLARFEPLWPANALAAMISQMPCPAPRVFSIGYHEASLIFATSSWPAFTSADVTVAEASASGCAIVYVEARHAQEFQDALGTAVPVEIGRFDGFNMGRAEEISVVAWGFIQDG